MTKFNRWLQELDNSTVHSPCSSSESRSEEISYPPIPLHRVKKKTPYNWFKRLRGKQS